MQAGFVPAKDDNATMCFLLRQTFLCIFGCCSKIPLRILLRQIKEFQSIGVQNTAAHILGSRFRNWFLCGQHTAFIIRAVDLPLQLTFGIMLLSTELQIKMPFLHGFCAGHDLQVIGPVDLCHQWRHKFIIPVSLIELLHAVQSAAIETLYLYAALRDVGCGLINDLITKRRVCADI